MRMVSSPLPPPPPRKILTMGLSIMHYLSATAGSRVGRCIHLSATAGSRVGWYIHVSLTMFPNMRDTAKEELKGEVHPKIKTAYLVVFGALSQTVKVRGACEKPFWIYARKRLNNCAPPPPPPPPPAPDSDDVLVEAACPTHKNASSSTTKTSSLSGAGVVQFFQLLIYPKRLITCTLDLHHSTPLPEHYEI